MKKHWLGVRWAVVMTILGGTLAGATDAAACGGEWIPEVEIDFRPQGVARAEKALEQGKYVAAAEIGRATSELQSREKLVCRLLLEKKKHSSNYIHPPA